MQDVEQRFASGVRLLQSGQAGKALPVFKAILKAFPNHPDTLYYTALAELDVGKPKQALQHAKQAQSAEPHNGHISNLRGLCLNALGREIEALGFLEARKEFWQQQNPVYARDNAAKVRRKKKRCN